MFILYNLPSNTTYPSESELLSPMLQLPDPSYYPNSMHLMGFFPGKNPTTTTVGPKSASHSCVNPVSLPLPWSSVLSSDLSLYFVGCS